MKDALIYIALIAAVVGVLLLSYAQDRVYPPLSRVGELSNARVGDNVRFAGNVTKTHSFSGGSLTLAVSDGTGTMDVFIPNYVAKRLENQTYAAVEVTGALKFYKGGREVVVEDYENLVVLR